MGSAAIFRKLDEVRVRGVARCAITSTSSTADRTRGESRERDLRSLICAGRVE